ncbi:M56 family metallopeptidase [Papillibacter cinnamivorans]|uniref:Signal transducer regulating beta-lactamase production, contains metallopeptidase domain n=1 Tax=Papillibacter cinnamivorans DSM 12816 TaxID=1122930 RepID=A0A1W2A330_9FIRM|nr:M56 family metallopeptidase [Papillibacter cinnamivorans]SMC55075.1 Signal transducer regulating beta-lactamase production, contains metallopeptidase domain [Papillibacter cinnamivorans DSM 12816]
MEGLFLKILNMSITGGYVILAVVLIRLLLRRAPKKYSYFLWAVVFFRLVCPVSFSSAISIFGIKPFNMSAAQSSGAAALTYVPGNIGLMTQPRVTVGIPMANSLISGSLPSAAPAASVNPLQIWVSVGTALWFIGMAALLLYGIVSFIRVRRRMSTAVLRKDGIRQSDKIRTPFILGFFRPKIYIPFGLSEKEEEYILSHERYHLRRMDHIIKPVGFLVLVLHWFNPLVWLAYALMSRDMEMSCDEYVLAHRGGGISAAYSTSLLSFASNRRLPSAGPLCFGETGIRERIRNALNWKRPRLWVTVAAGVLCALAIVSCAANPKESQAAEDGMPIGTYAFEKQVYMNPLSSFIAFDDYVEYYALTDNTFTVISYDGNRYPFSITPEETEFDEAAFKDSFFIQMEPIDVSQYKIRKQYNLIGANRRIYVMDDEIWIASVHEITSGTRPGEYIWSIYRIVPYDGVLPGTISPDAGAKAESLELLDGIFQGGAYLSYIDMGSLAQSHTSSVRHFALPEDEYLERYRVLFDCDWEKSDELRDPADGEACLFLGKDTTGFWFFPYTNEVSYMEDGTAAATWRAGSGTGTLYEVILAEFSGYEADYTNVTIPAGEGDSFEEAARAYLEEYGTYLQNMTPENLERITDFKTLDTEVFLTKEGDDSIFGFRCRFAVKPVVYNSVFWWSGNTETGTGELDGWLIMYRELRLERQDGLWQCTDMGTGGLSLE